MSIETYLERFLERNGYTPHRAVNIVERLKRSFRMVHFEYPASEHHELIQKDLIPAVREEAERYMQENFPLFMRAG